MSAITQDSVDVPCSDKQEYCVEVQAQLSALHASNGEPLLLFGEDAKGDIYLWPMPAIERHPLAFARWTKRNVYRWRGKRITLQHPMCARTRRWLEWLDCRVTENQVSV